MQTFTTEPLHTVWTVLEQQLTDGGEARCRVPDPDHGLGLYAGEHTPHGVHRPWLTWTDLADVLGAHLLTPERDGDFVLLRFHRAAPVPRRMSADGYGAGSTFQRVDKREDPHLLRALGDALGRAHLTPGTRALVLGVGSGRDLDLLKLLSPAPLALTGLDLDESALTLAAARHPDATLLQRDIAALPDPALGRFGLILALSVLHGHGLHLGELLPRLCHEQLTPSGSVIVGFPNCRYREGTLSYGTRVLNYREPELGLLVRDAAWTRKYLQGHGFTVTVQGKYELLVSGVRKGG